jgi:hypothetical protein
MYVERMPYELRQIDNVVLVDDFVRGLDTTNTWNTVLSTSATAAAAAGIVTLTNAGTTANDEVYLFSRQALFTPGSNHNAYLTAYIQWTEQNTNQANVFFGIMSGVASGALVSGNGGMRTTGTCIGLHKVGGGTNWIAHAQNPSGSTSTLDDLSTTQAGNSATYTKLEIEIMAQYGSTAEISYRVENVLLRYNNNNQQVIKHQLDLTSLAAAELCVLLRAGTTATNAESLLIDYAAGNIVR